MNDSNLTPTQRLWKARRQRWAAHKAAQRLAKLADIPCRRKHRAGCSCNRPVIAPECPVSSFKAAGRVRTAAQGSESI
jgi:hypothetical protein